MTARDVDSSSIRRGAVLLEAIVALTIIATAATMTIASVAESEHAYAHAREAEGAMRRANAFFAVAALWPREDLDRHLGDRPEGPWRLHVGRPTSTLYVLTLSDSATGRALLETSLFRPDTVYNAL